MQATIQDPTDGNLELGKFSIELVEAIRTNLYSLRQISRPSLRLPIRHKLSGRNASFPNFICAR